MDAEPRRVTDFIMFLPWGFYVLFGGGLIPPLEALSIPAPQDTLLSSARPRTSPFPATFPHDPGRNVFNMTQG
jgi:hypothetical protein